MPKKKKKYNGYQHKQSKSQKIMNDLNNLKSYDEQMKYLSDANPSKNADYDENQHTQEQAKFIVQHILKRGGTTENCQQVADKMERLDPKIPGKMNCFHLVFDKDTSTFDVELITTV